MIASRSSAELIGRRPARGGPNGGRGTSRGLAVAIRPLLSLGEGLSDDLPAIWLEPAESPETLSSTFFFEDTFSARQGEAGRAAPRREYRPDGLFGGPG